MKSCAVVTVCLLAIPVATGRIEQTQPQPAGAGRLVYDTHRRQVVLVDTINSSEPSNLRTWTWNGDKWEIQPGEGPSRRVVFAVAYDQARRRVVMFGGATIPATASINETWEIDGPTWTRVADTNPPGRDHHTLVYDEARRKIVLFGGGRFEKGKPYHLPEDTWKWDGTTWKRIATNGPGARSLAGMTYDSRQRLAVLFGGNGARSSPDAPRPYLNDTWTWDGKTWRKRNAEAPPVRYGHAMAFDPKAGVTLIYGGSTEDVQYADMWQWNGEQWSEIKLTGVTPGPRFGASMVYDAARERTVLFGGRRGDTTTWEWDGRSWRELK